MAVPLLSLIADDYSVGWFVSLLVRKKVLLADLCERKILFRLKIYDRLRQATAKRTGCRRDESEVRPGSHIPVSNRLGMRFVQFSIIYLFIEKTNILIIVGVCAKLNF